MEEKSSKRTLIKQRFFLSLSPPCQRVLLSAFLLSPRFLFFFNTIRGKEWNERAQKKWIEKKEKEKESKREREREKGTKWKKVKETGGKLKERRVG